MCLEVAVGPLDTKSGLSLCLLSRYMWDLAVVFILVWSPEQAWGTAGRNLHLSPRWELLTCLVLSSQVPEILRWCQESLQQVKSSRLVPNEMGLDPSANTRRTVPAPQSLRALETSQLLSSRVAHGLNSYNLSGTCPASYTGLPMNKRCSSGLWYPFLPSHSPWESHLVLSPGITLSGEIMPCQHMSTDAVLFCPPPSSSLS